MKFRDIVLHNPGTAKTNHASALYEIMQSYVEILKYLFSFTNYNRPGCWQTHACVIR